MKKQIILALLLALAMVSQAWAERTITDSRGKKVQVPDKVDKVICSGPGSLRLLTYLQAQNDAIAVDDIEHRKRFMEFRPYALANPQFKKLPLFGEFRGHDNPELILSLEPQPQVIFKTYATMGYNPDELAQKTGIPVIVLNYGNLAKLRPQLYESIKIMGQTVGKEKRAQEVCDFMEKQITDLENRTKDIPEDQRPTVFVGAVSHKGAHGFHSTEPIYPPFTFIHAKNLAYDGSKSKKELSHSDISKEKILEWDPDYLFLDLSTLQLGDKASGLYELQTDPAYQALTAVQEGRTYAVLPYNSYTTNYGSIIANAYFIGKLLYPDRFKDIDPVAKADEIYTFLVGKPVYGQLDKIFGGRAFKKLDLK